MGKYSKNSHCNSNQAWLECFPSTCWRKNIPWYYLIRKYFFSIRNWIQLVKSFSFHHKNHQGSPLLPCNMIGYDNLFSSNENPLSSHREVLFIMVLYKCNILLYLIHYYCMYHLSISIKWISLYVVVSFLFYSIYLMFVRSW